MAPRFRCLTLEVVVVLRLVRAARFELLFCVRTIIGVLHEARFFIAM
jgi:hypothetical protein